jgi:hypothetical protein
VDVSHEWDRDGIAPKWSAGEPEPSPGRRERHPDRLAPRQGVAGVVDLVEHNESAPAQRSLSVQGGVGGDLGIRHGHAGEVGRGLSLGVAEAGIQRDPEPVRRLRPLVLEMLCRRDDRDSGDLTSSEQFCGDRQRERGLPGARRRDEQEVALITAEVRLVRVTLPATE